jgi:hypothetical protein
MCFRDNPTPCNIKLLVSALKRSATVLNKLDMEGCSFVDGESVALPADGIFQSQNLKSVNHSACQIHLIGSNTTEALKMLPMRSRHILIFATSTSTGYDFRDYDLTVRISLKFSRKVPDTIRQTKSLTHLDLIDTLLPITKEFTIILQENQTLTSLVLTQKQD